MIEHAVEYQTEDGDDEFRDSPERRLLVAVLAVAVNDVNSRSRHRAAALAWIGDESQACPRMTGLWFPDLCEHLGLSPDAVRRAVLNGTARRHIPLGNARHIDGETS